MLMSISTAGTDSVSGLVSTIVYIVYAVQSINTMTWFMLGMAAYPEVQKKCQEELDRVIGRSRMPTLADRGSLPYMCATSRETLRWRAVAPLGESLPKTYSGSSPIVGDSGLQHYTMEVSPPYLVADNQYTYLLF